MKKYKALLALINIHILNPIECKSFNFSLMTSKFSKKKSLKTFYAYSLFCILHTFTPVYKLCANYKSTCSLLCHIKPIKETHFQ